MSVSRRRFERADDVPHPPVYAEQNTNTIIPTYSGPVEGASGPGRAKGRPSVPHQRRLEQRLTQPRPGGVCGYRRRAAALASSRARAAGLKKRVSKKTRGLGPGLRPKLYGCEASSSGHEIVPLPFKSIAATSRALLHLRTAHQP